MPFLKEGKTEKESSCCSEMCLGDLYIGIGVFGHSVKEELLGWMSVLEALHGIP